MCLELSMNFLSFTVKKSIVKCHDFKLRLRYDSAALNVVTSGKQLYSKANDVIAYLERQAFSECQNTKVSIKDLRSDSSQPPNLDILPVISVQFTSSISVENATKERLASCVSVMVNHIQDNGAQVTQNVSSFQNTHGNVTYPCQSVAYLLNETCCDESAAKCCPANHVYIKQSNWATSYCCKFTI